MLACSAGTGDAGQRRIGAVELGGLRGKRRPRRRFEALRLDSFGQQVEDDTTVTMACSAGRGGAPTGGVEQRQWRLGFAGAHAGKRSKGAREERKAREERGRLAGAALSPRLGRRWRSSQRNPVTKDAPRSCLPSPGRRYREKMGWAFLGPSLGWLSAQIC
jgi:hypothetical protein